MTFIGLYLTAYLVRFEYRFWLARFWFLFLGRLPLLACDAALYATGHTLVNLQLTHLWEDDRMWPEWSINSSFQVEDTWLISVPKYYSKYTRRHILIKVYFFILSFSSSLPTRTDFLLFLFLLQLFPFLILLNLFICIIKIAIKSFSP